MSVFTYKPRFEKTSNEMLVEIYEANKHQYDKVIVKWMLNDMIKCIGAAMKLGGSYLTERQAKVVADAIKWGFIKKDSHTQYSYTRDGEAAMLMYMIYNN